MTEDEWEDDLLRRADDAATAAFNALSDGKYQARCRRSAPPLVHQNKQCVRISYALTKARHAPRVQDAVGGFTDALRLASPLAASSAAEDGSESTVGQGPPSAAQRARSIAAPLVARIRVGRSKALLALGSTARRVVSSPHFRCPRPPTRESVAPVAAPRTLPPRARAQGLTRPRELRPPPPQSARGRGARRRARPRGPGRAPAVGRLRAAGRAPGRGCGGAAGGEGGASLRSSAGFRCAWFGLTVLQYASSAMTRVRLLVACAGTAPVLLRLLVRLAWRPRRAARNI